MFGVNIGTLEFVGIKTVQALDKRDKGTTMRRGEAALQGGRKGSADAAPLRALPSAQPLASFRPAPHVRHRRARPSAPTDPHLRSARPSARRAHSEHSRPTASIPYIPRVRRPLFTVLRRLCRARPSARFCRPQRVCLRQCAHVTCKHEPSTTSTTLSQFPIKRETIDKDSIFSEFSTKLQDSQH